MYNNHNKAIITRAQKYLKNGRLTVQGFELLNKNEQDEIINTMKEAIVKNFLTQNEVIDLIKNKFNYDVKPKFMHTMINKYNIHADNKERLKNVSIKHFGVENPWQAKSVKDKIKQNNLENYGVEYNWQREDVKQLIKQTKLERYDNENFVNVNKKKQTNLEKYGVEHNWQREDIKNKIKKTNLNKYGYESPTQSKVIQDKIKQTCINNFGYDSPLKCPEIRRKQCKSAKMSSLEKKVNEFLKNNNFIYKSQYVISNNKFSHAFDFAIFKDNKLELLIDADGLFYHGYLSDFDGKHVRSEDLDENRLSLIPNNVKYITVIESNEDEAFNEIFKIYDLNYDDYIKDLFTWCKRISFPYPNYSDKTLIDGWNKLKKYEFESYNSKQRYGLKLINYFHKSIWECSVNNKPSIYDAWNNDNLLLKTIKNRTIYKNNIDPSKILAGFNISKIAPKISIFNPVLTKYLITKYLSNYSVIRDPFSGYSGRMLGTIASNKTYIGSDINDITINESKELANYLNLTDYTLFTENVNNLNEIYSDCAILTCPPYNLKENWNCQLENKSCDEWIDVTLSNIQCDKYLFVVDKTEKYKSFIVEELINTSHFNTNKEYVILINK